MNAEPGGPTPRRPRVEKDEGVTPFRFDYGPRDRVGVEAWVERNGAAVRLARDGEWADSARRAT
jgi:hypothetical protein